jgi:hypothetical protein
VSEFDEESTADVGGSNSYQERDAETDRDLRAVYERMTGPAAKEREFLSKPPMPALPAGISEDEAAKKEYSWVNTPLKDRQLAALSHREVATIKAAAADLGLPAETAADILALKARMDGETSQKPAAIDADTKASLDLYTKLVPEAKSHREASQFLSGLVEHVQRDPMGGSRAVLQSLGVQSPLQLLTPQEWEIARQHLLGNQQPQPQQAEPDDATLAAAISDWAGQRGLSPEDRVGMAEMLAGPTFRWIEGESTSSTLERAHKSFLRSQARAGKDHSNRRTDAALTHDLRKMARR